MQENLRDYLYKQVKNFSVTESEKKALHEYIELLVNGFEGVYKTINTESAIDSIVKSLESYAEKRKTNG